MSWTREPDIRASSRYSLGSSPSLASHPWMAEVSRARSTIEEPSSVRVGEVWGEGVGGWMKGLRHAWHIVLENANKNYVKIIIMLFKDSTTIHQYHCTQCAARTATTRRLIILPHSPGLVMFCTHSATWSPDRLFPVMWESSRDKIRRNLSWAIVPIEDELTDSSFFRHQSNSSRVCIASCRRGRGREGVFLMYY